MNKTLFAFLLTFLAGFSTMIGSFVIFIKKKNHSKIIVSSLSFASGVMICTSITDLIPESILLLRKNITFFSTIILSFLGLFLGIVLSMIIDNYIPDNFTSAKGSSLFRVGIISMLAIILHNIPEGIATFMASSNNIFLGISLSIAIAIHNIPEGISIAVPIYYSTGRKKTAIIYTFISAISEPFGAIICFLFLKKFINDIVLGIIFSTIAGIMLEISFRTLLPNAKKYNDKKNEIIFFVLGILFMLIKFFL